MDLFEYQAKQLFAAHGVPVGLGETADAAGSMSNNPSKRSQPCWGASGPRQRRRASLVAPWP